MKKILKYISLLAGVAFLTAACSQSDIDGNASEEMGTLRLSVNRRLACRRIQRSGSEYHARL